MQIYLVVLVCSMIQSVIGVGLLVFGTPTLLVLGHSFESTLSIVLPCSITISLLQVFESVNDNKSYLKDFGIFALVPTALALGFVLAFPDLLDPKKVVASLLIITGILRFFKPAQNLLVTFIKKYKKSYLLLMGLIHGFSNMGGGLLTIYSSSVSQGKDRIRSHIAAGYLAWGILQYLILLFKSPQYLSLKTLAYVGIAFVVYKSVGVKLFKFTSDFVYQHLITFLIFCYGITLFLK